MKKINIQKDLDSRAGISKEIPTTMFEKEVEIPIPELIPQRDEEPEIQNVQYAESPENSQPATDETTVHEKPQKRGRAPKGDI